jgi:hypothetical protein
LGFENVTAAGKKLHENFKFGVRNVTAAGKPLQEYFKLEAVKCN